MSRSKWRNKHVLVRTQVGKSQSTEGGRIVKRGPRGQRMHGAVSPVRKLGSQAGSGRLLKDLK